jgi:hypothetical protein
LTARFCKRIGEVIEDLVPTAEILNTYLPLPAAGDDLDMDHDEEDPEDEDVPDLEGGEEEGIPDDPAAGLPQNTGNMEFGKTPGGVDTAVTVNNSLTPPSVPGSTPPPTDDGESLFPDAPTKIQKLNHT